MATCEKCGSETQSMAYHRCGMTEERVREIARNVYREEHGAMLEFCEEQPAAPACPDCGHADGHAHYCRRPIPLKEPAAPASAPVTTGCDACKAEIALLRKWRDELRSVIEHERLEHSVQQQKLASAEKALDEINRAMPGIGGYSSDVARVRDALTMTGRLGGKEQGK